MQSHRLCGIGIASLELTTIEPGVVMTEKHNVPRNIWMTGKVAAGAVTLADLATAMERIAPTHLAEKWDNVGLLSGHRSSRVKKALLAIDITPPVHNEAIRLGVD